MPIDRISIPRGEIFDPQGDPRASVADIALRNSALLVRLRPGEYDLTPEVWENPTYSHNLLVHGDGTGTYRLFPRTPASSSTSLRLESDVRQVSPMKPGGRIEKVNAEQPFIVVLGGSPDSSIRLFEIILHNRA